MRNPNPTSVPSEDRELMRAFARRETRAFDELFERFGGSIYGLGWRLFDDEDAAGAFLERVFVRVSARAARYGSSPVPLETWVALLALAVSIEMADERDGRRTDVRRMLDDPEPAVA
jgi:hypothetical protein